MNIENTITDLIHLPRNFDSQGDASIYSLLREVGYFDLHDQVTESAIQKRLREYPDLVREWMDFSEGKRVSAGWFFQEGPNGYQVGYSPESNNSHLPVDYSDAVAACAAFIKREAEDIRNGRR